MGVQANIAGNTDGAKRTHPNENLFISKKVENACPTPAEIKLAEHGFFRRNHTVKCFEGLKFKSCEYVRCEGQTISISPEMITAHIIEPDEISATIAFDGTCSAVCFWARKEPAWIGKKELEAALLRLNELENG